LPDRSRNRLGSVFLDYRNKPDLSDHNIFIYGHNMDSDDIFGSLMRYTSQSYYERHYSMYIFTSTAGYELLLIAGYILDSAFETPPMRFVDNEDFEQYIIDIRNRSVFDSGIEATYGDQLVFLCTCTPSGFRSSQNERFVLVGKLIRL
jgi:sortase B